MNTEYTWTYFNPESLRNTNIDSPFVMSAVAETEEQARLYIIGHLTKLQKDYIALVNIPNIFKGTPGKDSNYNISEFNLRNQLRGIISVANNVKRSQIRETQICSHVNNVGTIANFLTHMMKLEQKLVVDPIGTVIIDASECQYIPLMNND